MKINQLLKAAAILKTGWVTVTATSSGPTLEDASIVIYLTRGRSGFGLEAMSGLIQVFASEWDELGFNTCQDAVLEITELLGSAESSIGGDIITLEPTLGFK